VARAYTLYRLEEENRRLRARALPSPIGRIITGDQAMLKLCRSIERLATTDVPVLILGESGTGKELLAHALMSLGQELISRLFRLIAQLFRKHSSKASCSATNVALSLERCDRRLARSSRRSGNPLPRRNCDVPQSLQVKLLRFLQDQVIERIGDGARFRLTYGSCVPPIKISRPKWRMANSAKTYSIV